MSGGNDILHIGMRIEDLLRLASIIGTLSARRRTTGILLSAIVRRNIAHLNSIAAEQPQSIETASKKALEGLGLSCDDPDLQRLLPTYWFAPLKIYLASLYDEIEYVWHRFRDDEFNGKYWSDFFVNFFMMSGFLHKWKKFRHSYWHPEQRNINWEEELMNGTSSISDLFEMQRFVDNLLRQMEEHLYLKALGLVESLNAIQKTEILRLLYERQIARYSMFGDTVKIAQTREKQKMQVENIIKKIGKSNYGLQLLELTSMQRKLMYNLVDILMVFSFSEKEWNLLSSDGNIIIEPLAFQLPDFDYKDKYKHLGSRFFEACLWLHAVACEIYFICCNDEKCGFNKWLEYYKSGNNPQAAKQWSGLHKNLRVSIDAISVAILWPIIVVFREHIKNGVPAEYRELVNILRGVGISHMKNIRNAVAHVPSDPHMKLYKGLYFGELCMPGPIFSLWDPRTYCKLREPPIFGLYEELCKFARSELCQKDDDR